MKDTHSAASRAGGLIEMAALRLAGRYPFHARVLEQFRVTAEPGVGTMGVTFRGGDLLLLHNPDFVLATPARQLAGVLLHEVHHVVFGHLTADPGDYGDRWARTVAEEVTVNEFVKEPLPAGAITLDLFPGLPPLESTARRYRRLRRSEDRLPIMGPAAALAVPALGAGARANPAAPPGAGRLVDNHDVWQEARQDPRAARDAIADALQQAALEADAAGLPAALREALQDAGVDLGPGVGARAGDGEYALLGDRDGRLDWRHLLRRYVGQELVSRPALSRPPRRFPGLAGVVPARDRRPGRPRLMAVIDTSGSITDETLERIDAELRRLAAGHEVTVVECDAAVHRVARYRRLRSVAGRGGTDFRPPLRPAFLRRHRPDLVVYFTDGFGPAPDRAPGVPVIWCLVPGGEPPAPWGRAVRMETAEEL